MANNSATKKQVQINMYINYYRYKNKDKIKTAGNTNYLFRQNSIYIKENGKIK